jgi:hypothetical protein
MSDRDFDTPEGDKLRYAVGQPMGAKSSFPMLALTHHIIVQMMADRAGLSPLFSDYAILGDDNTIADSRVAKLYVEFMTLIGMNIDITKSYIHRPGCLSAGEICKRIFVEGFELTAFNPKLLVKTNRFGHMAFSLHNLLESRGSPIDDSKLPLFFAAFLKPKDLAT